MQLIYTCQYSLPWISFKWMLSFLFVLYLPREITDIHKKNTINAINFSSNLRELSSLLLSIIIFLQYQYLQIKYYMHISFLIIYLIFILGKHIKRQRFTNNQVWFNNLFMLLILLKTIWNYALKEKTTFKIIV